jgi:multicomponent Na+:H+ antiporter subunit A
MSNGLSILLPASLAVILGSALLAPRIRMFRLLALAPIAALAMLGLAWNRGDDVVFAVAWVSELGVALRFRLDGLAALFAFLVTGIGAAVVVYATGYLGSNPARGRFMAYLLLFMSSMLGLVLADDLILLFVFWELTSIASYLLIGFKHESADSRRKALQALLVTGSGGLALLAGFILLGIEAGTFVLSEILADPDRVLSSRAAFPAMLLIILGAFTKSAQYPFHFWLPNAMAAPTPVSAYLHSATMVKAGVFLLARFNPLFGADVAWTWILIGFGAFTMLYAAGRGLFETDLKRILAFTTLSVLGALVMLIGVGTELAIKSAILFLLGHALYKAVLFMTAGNLDHATGTRDVRLLFGLRRAMPLTMLAAGLAALSKAGFPPFVGFIGKEYVYKAGLALESMDAILVSGVFLTNSVLLALAFKVGIHPFWHRGEWKGEGTAPDPGRVREVSPLMWSGPLILAFSGLVLGLAPGLFTTPIVAASASSVVGYAFPVKVALWHGLGLPLLISGVTLATGLGLYRLRRILWCNPEGGRILRIVDTEPLYDRLLAGFIAGSSGLTRVLQNGSLRLYLLTAIGTTTVLVAGSLLALGGVARLGGVAPIGPFEFALVGSMMAAALFAVLTDSRLNALVGLGVVGLGTALLFALHGAPDLALTQILVEVLLLALFMFVVAHLPAFRRYSSRSVRWVDGTFAIAFGCVVGWLVLKATNLQLAPSISAQLAEWSYTLAKGRNVVNVILVDFRALDTFGEIIVLGIAALGVGILLGGRSTDKNSGPDSDAGPGLRPSLPLSIGSRFLLPVFVMIALVALYRGHNNPGGGFIAGLVAAAGYILISLADGVAAARRALRVSPVGLMVIGLIVALVGALAGPLAGAGFFKGLWLPAFSLPVLGTVHLGTPLVFDVGVFLLVLGFTVHVAFTFEQIRNDDRPDSPAT